MTDRILIVEDDDGIRETLKYHLTAAGYVVSEARDGAIGLRLARTSRPDLILLDLMLPGMSGMEFCRALRRSSRVPIIMVTAKDSEVDKIVGLELGADDYVTKPFSVREVLARVNAVIRRSRAEAAERQAPERDQIGNFLSHMVAHSGRVQSREVLLHQVWGPDFMGDRKTVDVHVRWLREKFAGRVPFEIVTVRGAGYRLDRMVDTAAPAGAGEAAAG